MQLLWAVSSGGGGQTFCFAHYDRVGNQFWLYHGQWGYFVGPVAAATESSLLEDQACHIVTAYSRAIDDGLRLRLSVSVRFKSPLYGARNIYVRAYDQLELDTGWGDKGDWLVEASAPSPDVYGPFQISRDTEGYRWEPTAAAGPTAWAHAWNDLWSLTSWVSVWQPGSGWGSQIEVKTPGYYSTQLLDLNLAWEAARARFAIVGLNPSYAATNANEVFHGYSAAPFAGWPIEATPALSTLPGIDRWDYPSIAIDSQGRKLVGAFALIGSTAQGYYAAVAPDGENFWAPVRVGSLPGGLGRVVAAGNIFHTFVPLMVPDGANKDLPYGIRRYESADAVNWYGPFPDGSDFDPPKNHHEPAPLIYYAPLVAVAGNASGIWATVIPVNNGGYNNVRICTSNRGCAIVNEQPNEQFLASVSITAGGGFWVSYLTYTAPPSVTLELHIIYIPPDSGNWIGIRAAQGIDPQAWWQRPRCPDVPCHAAGDYQTIASQGPGLATAPFVGRPALTVRNHLMQVFLRIPELLTQLASGASQTTFTPQVVLLPPGTSLVGRGRPHRQRGVPPGSRWTLLGNAFAAASASRGTQR